MNERFWQWLAVAVARRESRLACAQASLLPQPPAPSERISRTHLSFSFRLSMPPLKTLGWRWEPFPRGSTPSSATSDEGGSLSSR